MAATFRILRDKVRLHGEEEKHEQTDAWSNRDLIPLPPHRRTWGWFHYFGYWAISSLSIGNWQQPNTFLTQGLSVKRSMMAIVIGRALISLFSCLVAWCGFRWHIGFTIQNRFTWGLRGSYIPLAQRVLLNFIWTAYQAWTGGRLIGVALTAIWPSFNNIPNTFSESFPATSAQFVGFFLFWLFSVPFLFVPPEKFKLPFQIVCAWCALGMVSMMIWALARAHGVGPLFNTGQTIASGAEFDVNWISMAAINQMLGGIAAGITNSSDFSRYGRTPKHYVFGTVLSAWIVGTLVSFVGLVVTSACQVLYGEVYWNPPDLLMVMMDSGHGSSKSRAGVFFLATGFALTSMFENICGNAVAGGIDLSGIWPRYINIRRGAIITFIACWIVQPWQLVNRATTFIAVLSSFSVFLAPMIGMMTCDFFLLRNKNIRLSHLYRPHNSDYWYWHGFNLRAIPCWLAGWAPTVGGLIVSVQEDASAPKALYELYYMAFLVGFFISGTLFFAINKIFPPISMGEKDELDHYGTFTAEEAIAVGIAPLDLAEEVLVVGGDGLTKSALEKIDEKV
ncbi:uracil permease [Xylogone sp. PMI_703]|nr:uracil permease [Xylogone sp. PMI_703]